MGQHVADLVVGGGTRSLVRGHTFPNQIIGFTGTKIWRDLIPKSFVAHLPDLTKATAWWYGPTGHFYGSLVDDPSDTAEENKNFDIASPVILFGAFGSGAAFALEDGWILARAIENTRYSLSPIPNALKNFDAIRSPYYLRMYQHIDSKKNIQETKIANPKQTFEESLKVRPSKFGGEDKLSWIYGNDIERVSEKYLEDGKLTKRVDWVHLASLVQP